MYTRSSISCYIQTLSGKTGGYPADDLKNKEKIKIPKRSPFYLEVMDEALAGLMRDGRSLHKGGTQFVSYEQLRPAVTSMSCSPRW